MAKQNSFDQFQESLENFDPDQYQAKEASYTYDEDFLGALDPEVANRFKQASEELDPELKAFADSVAFMEAVNLQKQANYIQQTIEGGKLLLNPKTAGEADDLFDSRMSDIIASKNKQMIPYKGGLPASTTTGTKAVANYNPGPTSISNYNPGSKGVTTVDLDSAPTGELNHLLKGTESPKLLTSPKGSNQMYNNPSSGKKISRAEAEHLANKANEAAHAQKAQEYAELFGNTPNGTYKGLAKDIKANLGMGLRFAKQDAGIAADMALAHIGAHKGKYMAGAGVAGAGALGAAIRSRRNAALQQGIGKAILGHLARNKGKYGLAAGAGALAAGGLYAKQASEEQLYVADLADTTYQFVQNLYNRNLSSHLAEESTTWEKSASYVLENQK